MRFPWLVLLLLGVAACGSEPPPSEVREGRTVLDLQAGERPVGGFLISAGQPDEARFRAVAASGTAILSLREAAKEPFDEAALAAEIGADFQRVTLTKKTILDKAAREAVYDALQAAARRPQATYVHCRSGNRVGAVWALFRAEREGLGVEGAVAEGKRAGLTKLEPVVRKILGGGD